MLWSTLVLPPAGSKPTRRRARNPPRRGRTGAPRPARITPRNIGSTARDHPRRGAGGRELPRERRTRSHEPPTAIARTPALRERHHRRRPSRSATPPRTRTPRRRQARELPNFDQIRRPPQCAHGRPRHADVPQSGHADDLPPTHRGWTGCGRRARGAMPRQLADAASPRDGSQDGRKQDWAQGRTQDRLQGWLQGWLQDRPSDRARNPTPPRAASDPPPAHPPARPLVRLPVRRPARPPGASPPPPRTPQSSRLRRTESRADPD